MGMQANIDETNTFLAYCFKHDVSSRFFVSCSITNKNAIDDESNVIIEQLYM